MDYHFFNRNKAIEVVINSKYLQSQLNYSEYLLVKGWIDDVNPGLSANYFSNKRFNCNKSRIFRKGTHNIDLKLMKFSWNSLFSLKLFAAMITNVLIFLQFTKMFQQIAGENWSGWNETIETLKKKYFYHEVIIWKIYLCKKSKSK